ncbi:MAG: T9SS type A sorting domain-containing protein, partial [Flavobacteriales bacterium]
SECISFVVGVGEFANKLQFNLYPNPTRDILNLEIAGVLGSSSLSVYDAMGALVRTEQINGATSIFSVTDLSVGTYMLVLRTNEIVVSKPFVKL